MPKVSVVIPVYKAEAFLEEALESVLRVRPDLSKEILLVEDGSPDQSLALAQRLEAEYPEVRLFRHPNGENRGAGASRNLALSHAEGEWVAFLDADDLWLPARLDGAEEILDSRPEVDGVFDYSIVEYEDEAERKKFFDPEARRVGRKKMVPPERFFLAFLNGEVSWDTRGILVRRRVFERLGGFEESLRKRQDVQMWCRMAAILHLVPSPVQEAVAVYRRHPGCRYDPELRILDPGSVVAGELMVWETLEAWFRAQDLGEPRWSWFLNAYATNLGKWGLGSKAFALALREGRVSLLARTLRGLVPGPRTWKKWWKGDRLSR